jgi:ribonuclease BN (tRNA processing enzyme)
MLPSAAGNGPALQFALSYLINDQVAIDAGSLGFQASLSLQQQVRHLFLTHPHLDHLASLPVWLDNVFQSGVEPPHVYGSPNTWSILTGDLMNDRLWPDLARIAAAEQPFYVPHLLLDGATVRVAEVEVTAEPLDHVVPTLGYLVDDGDVAAAFVSDTGPTDRIWRVLAGNPRLRAIFLEASFPNRLDWLAEKTKHLTPARAGTELRKLRELNPALTPRIYFVHMKPLHHQEIAAEIAGLGLPLWQLVEAGREIRL